MNIKDYYFYPKRGCRQSDPISQYIFLFCADVLRILRRNNKDFKGIIIEGLKIFFFLKQNSFGLGAKRFQKSFFISQMEVRIGKQHVFKVLIKN